MSKLPIEIAIGQTNMLIEDEVCKAVGKVGIHINKEELLKALKAYEFVEELINYIAEYPDDDYMTMECLCRKLVKHDLIDKKEGYYLVADGIKADRKTEPTHDLRTETHECVKDTHDKIEPSSSEKPNNSTISKMEQVKQRSCDTCKGKDVEGWKNPCLGCTEFTFYEPKDEPTISKMEQVEDEPQYDIGKGTIRCDNCAENGSYKCSKCDGEIYFKRLAVKDEPQTEADKYWLSLLQDVVDGKMSAASANQAWYEYINHKDEPQTDCPWK